MGTITAARVIAILLWAPKFPTRFTHPSNPKLRLKLEPGANRITEDQEPALKHHELAIARLVKAKKLRIQAAPDVETSRLEPRHVASGSSTDPFAGDDDRDVDDATLDDELDELKRRLSSTSDTNADGEPKPPLPPAMQNAPAPGTPGAPNRDADARGIPTPGSAGDLSRRNPADATKPAAPTPWEPGSSYDELKLAATSRGLQYGTNVSKKSLLEMLEKYDDDKLLREEQSAGG